MNVLSEVVAFVLDSLGTAVELGEGTMFVSVVELVST